MATKKKQKYQPRLTNVIRDQIRFEYSCGATLTELVSKFERGKSIVSRIINGVTRDGEQLANKLADVNREIGTHSAHEQVLIRKRSRHIEQIKDFTLKGTEYITGRTLKKLDSMSDDEITFNDLNQSQNVMHKAHAMVNPKADTQIEVNNITGIKLISD